MRTYLIHLLIFLGLCALPLTGHSASHASAATASTTGSILLKETPSQNSVAPKKVRKRKRPRRRPPIAEFFACLGAAAVLTVVGIAVSNIAILPIVLFTLAGVAFIAALLFLFRWVYYYW